MVGEKIRDFICEKKTSDEFFKCEFTLKDGSKRVDRVISGLEVVGDEHYHTIIEGDIIKVFNAAPYEERVHEREYEKQHGWTITRCEYLMLHRNFKEINGKNTLYPLIEC